MMQVRRAFVAGMHGTGEGTGRQPADFYRACAEYLGFSMGRLYAQDGLIHDLLSQRIPASDTNAHAELAVLAGEQRQGRAMVEKLGRAALGLGEGSGAMPAFEAAAREFAAGLGSSMRSRRNPFSSYTDKLFDEADWTRIAGVTPDSIAEEGRLFAAVRRAAPAGLDPEGFGAGHTE